MADRRSMTDALSLTPEKAAFIQGVPIPPKPAATEKANDSRFRQIDATQAVPNKNLSDSTGEARQSRLAQKASRQREAASKPHSETPFIDQLLVPLTTRLQPKTANALRRAYLEQKLKHVRPSTQQEIIEAAVNAWLLQNGYLTE